jgi:hypothetical protein
MQQVHDIDVSHFLFAAGGALIASLIGFIGGLITSGLNRRSEERRCLRELAIKVAFDRWKIEHDMIHAYRSKGTFYNLTPLEVYLVNTLALVELIEAGRTDGAEMKELLAKIGATTKAAQDTLQSK